MVVDIPVAQGAADPPPTLRCPDCADPLLISGEAWICGPCRRAGLVACCRWCSLTAWVPAGRLGASGRRQPGRGRLLGPARGRDAGPADRRRRPGRHTATGPPPDRVSV